MVGVFGVAHCVLSPVAAGAEILPLFMGETRGLKGAAAVVAVLGGVRRVLRFEMQGDPFGLHAGLLGEVLVIEQISLVLLLPVRLGAVCLFEFCPVDILHVGERGAFIDL